MVGYIKTLLDERIDERIDSAEEILSTRKQQRGYISEPKGHILVWSQNVYCGENICKNDLIFVDKIIFIGILANNAKIVERYDPKKNAWFGENPQDKDVVACIRVDDKYLYYLLRHDQWHHSVAVFNIENGTWNLPFLDGNINEGFKIFSFFFKLKITLNVKF